MAKSRDLLVYPRHSDFLLVEQLFHSGLSPRSILEEVAKSKKTTEGACQFFTALGAFVALLTSKSFAVKRYFIVGDPLKAGTHVVPVIDGEPIDVSKVKAGRSLRPMPDDPEDKVQARKMLELAQHHHKGNVIMNAPKMIKHKGQLYILASAPTHEKCPTGQHWNAKAKKCMKVPENLRKAIKHANGMSKSAKGLPPGHKMHKQYHANAAKTHNIASGIAARHGFNSLAEKHRAKQNDHLKQAK